MHCYKWGFDPEDTPYAHVTSMRIDKFISFMSSVTGFQVYAWVLW